MRIRKLGTVGLSLLLVVVLAVWLASGDVKQARDTMPDAQSVEEERAPQVQVENLQARLYRPSLMLQGELEPWRSVDISARVAATVEEILVQQGEQVTAGTVLLRLSEDNRSAVAESWRARVRKLEADLDAAQRLRSRDLTSESEILSLQSDIASARAELSAANLAVGNLTPEAPFDGIVNQRYVDEGDLIQVGTPLFSLVQTERLKALAQVPQQSVDSVSVGQAVSVNLLNGGSLEGEVSFIASAADPSTRSFPMEITVANPERKRIAGGSATLRVALPELRAHFISPAYLSLGDDGRPGVNYVDGNDEVAFSTVKLLSVTTEGAWVTGLPEELRLITRGAGFVSPGQKVRPVDRDDNRG